METEFIRLSDTRIAHELWVDTGAGRYVILPQFRKGAIGVVDCMNIYDSQNGDLLEESFKSLYEARGFVNRLVVKERSQRDHQDRS